MMKSRFEQEKMIVQLTGEIDHRAASIIRDEIEQLISTPKVKHLILDFSDVSFMDSSGIGMIIGRYKTMKARGGSVSSKGLSDSVQRVYRIAGLHRIIPIEECGGENGK